MKLTHSIIAATCLSASISAAASPVPMEFHWLINGMSADAPRSSEPVSEPEPEEREPLVPDAGAWEAFADHHGLPKTWNDLFWNGGATFDALPPAGYPLTTTTGQVSIINYNISDVDSLSTLREVGGNLQLSGNNLTNLRGLSSLEKVGGRLWLQNNQLATLSGLSSLKIIGGDFTATGNHLDSLNDIGGLDVWGTIRLDASYSGPKLSQDSPFCSKNYSAQFFGGSKWRFCEGEVEAADMCSKESVELSAPYTKSLAELGFIYHRPGSPENEVVVHQVHLEGNHYAGTTLNPDLFWQDVSATSSVQPVRVHHGPFTTSVGAASLNPSYTVHTGTNKIRTGPEIWNTTDYPFRTERGEMKEVYRGVPHYAVRFVNGYYASNIMATLSDILSRTENYNWCKERGYPTLN